MYILDPIMVLLSAAPDSYSLRLSGLKDCKKEYYARNYRSFGRLTVDISIIEGGLHKYLTLTIE
jgi:hypothetical protein